MSENDFARDLFFPTGCFLILWLVLYGLVRKFQRNTEIINAKRMKQLDFVWLVVAAVGLFFAGFDTIKSDAAAEGAQAREDYHWAFNSFKVWFDPLPTVCTAHYSKTQWSPPDFDSLVQQQRFDCEWARQTAAQLGSLENPNFDSYSFPQTPPLKKIKGEASDVEDLRKQRDELTKLHDNAVSSGRVASYIDRNPQPKRIGPYLLAFALAIRFAKIHGELRL